MPDPTIAIATITETEAAQLDKLRRSLKRVHKSAPPTNPARVASRELSVKLQQFHRRGVPLHVLAEVVGLSHQAVRVRVRNAEWAPQATDALNGAPRLSAPPKDSVLVADSGVHRRLHLYEDPAQSASTLLAMSPEIPLLKSRDQVVTWLESQTADPPSRRSFTATPLRTPPLVYVPRSVVNTVLNPLTDDEDGEA
jgi:hypothetical protein